MYEMSIKSIISRVNMSFKDFVIFLRSLPKWRNPNFHLSYFEGFYEFICNIGKRQKEHGETQPVKQFFSGRYKNSEKAIKQVYDEMIGWLG